MWTKENVEKLISLLEKNRCLWDATDENRKKKGKIAEAHDSIASEMQCDVNVIKKKINSIRSQMNAERTKVAKGGKSGAGGSDIYVPKWEYYNSLMFMYKGNNINEGTTDSISNFYEIFDDSSDLSEPHFLANFDNNAETLTTPTASDIPTPTTTHSSKKRKTKQSDEDMILQHCLQTIMAPPPPMPQAPKIKLRTKALLDSITALLSEMEVEDESLGIQFARELRKTFNEFEDLFEERKRGQLSRWRSWDTSEDDF